MVILFIGDIVGEPGRRVLTSKLQKVIETHHVDLIVGNGENIAGHVPHQPFCTVSILLILNIVYT